jgi:hypothetical protein
VEVETVPRSVFPVGKGGEGDVRENKKKRGEEAFPFPIGEAFALCEPVKFSVSLLTLSALVFAACDTPVTRRSQYSPMTPGKNPGVWSTTLRKQTYLSGIPAKNLRPWTVKKKEEPGTNPLPQGGSPPAPKEEPVPPPVQ